MSIWRTILLGIAGSILGGVALGLLLCRDAYAWAFPFTVGAASLLLAVPDQRRPLFRRRRAESPTVSWFGPSEELAILTPWQKSSDSSSEA